MFSLADQSLYVAELDLWLDSARSRARCYVSHGHADHARLHETIVTTPNNARICEARFGRKKQLAPGLFEAKPVYTFEEHAYNEPWTSGAHRLTLFSAGHVLGSAQLMIEGDAGRFVYTGDFKLGHSYTAEPPEVKRCDVLLMECTYGRPQYVFPVRAQVEEQIVDFAAAALEADAIPIFYAYSLGKAQEAMAILGKAGISLTVHGAIASVSEVYEACGVVLPSWERYDAGAFQGGRALIWPPSGKALPRAVRGKPTRTAVLTGWSLDRSATFRYGTDAAFCLSDHADFPSLLEYIERAQPRKVLLNHGRRDFVYRLRSLGVEAEYLEENAQLALF